MSGVGKVCGYTSIDDVKAIYDLDSEVFALRQLVKEGEQRSVDLQVKVDALAGQNARLRVALDVVQDRNKDLERRYLELDKKYQDEAAEPRWGSPVAWTIAGLSLAALLGVVVGVSFD